MVVRGFVFLGAGHFGFYFFDLFLDCVGHGRWFVWGVRFECIRMVRVLAFVVRWVSSIVGCRMKTKLVVFFVSGTIGGNDGRKYAQNLPFLSRRARCTNRQIQHKN